MADRKKKIAEKKAKSFINPDIGGDFLSHSKLKSYVNKNSPIKEKDGRGFDPMINEDMELIDVD